MTTVNTDYERMACIVAQMSRDEVKEEILHFKKGSFKLDFPEEYLDQLSVERLRHIHNSMTQLIKSDSFTAREFYELDSKLHETWFNATRKEYLWDTIRNSNCHYTRFRMLDIVAIKNFAQIVEEHEAILTALEKGDVDAY